MSNGGTSGSGSGSGQDVDTKVSDLRSMIATVDDDLSSLDHKINKLKSQKQSLIERRRTLEDKISKLKFQKVASVDWAAKSFSWSSKMDQALGSVFKLEEYRPYQLESMNAFLSGHDVIVVMPTGGGKSLTYQLPAVVTKGFTLVISPLVSLVEDQVMALQDLGGVNVAALNAATPKETTNSVHKQMTSPDCELQLLYVTPEKLAKSKMFMNKIQKAYEIGTFTHIAIDEVHCCSQWGHDFRPDYKYLGVLKKLFPKIPIIGLTATITTKVLNDVKDILNISSCLHFKASFNRPNLFYEVKMKPESSEEMIDQFAELLQGEFGGKSGIIYTLSIKDTEQLSEELSKRGVKALPYHASLEPTSRSKVHRKWLAGSCQVVVATIAFGMGIDKSNVRFVFHHSLSKSMENFYQESGRAGRDGLPAKCILFFKASDIHRLSTMVFVERTGLSKLYGMASYCLDTSKCRRQMISSHFDEKWENSDCDQKCDHCTTTRTKAVSKDLTIYAQTVIRIILKAHDVQEKLTCLKVINALLSTGPGKIQVKDWKCPKNDFNREMGERLVANMMIKGYLKEDFHYTPYSTLSYLILGDREVQTPVMISILSNELP